jgi:hypothetical protein
MGIAVQVVATTKMPIQAARLTKCATTRAISERPAGQSDTSKSIAASLGDWNQSMPPYLRRKHRQSETDQSHAVNEKGCAREPDWICRMLANTEQAKMIESQ